MLAQVDAYIDQFDSKQAYVLKIVRQLILDAHPAIQEKYIYKIPFYCLKNNLCFLAFNKKRNRFVIGFIQGHIMPDPFNLLIADDNQKYVRHFVLEKSISEITSTLPQYLQFAIEIHNKNGV